MTDIDLVVVYASSRLLNLLLNIKKTENFCFYIMKVLTFYRLLTQFPIFLHTFCLCMRKFWTTTFESFVTNSTLKSPWVIQGLYKVLLLVYIMNIFLPKSRGWGICRPPTSDGLGPSQPLLYGYNSHVCDNDPQMHFSSDSFSSIDCIRLHASSCRLSNMTADIFWSQAPLDTVCSIGLFCCVATFVSTKNWTPKSLTILTF